jgi:hypothetical protein
VSNWTYVAIAYTVVWGSLAVYALLLARRVSQAREVARRLGEAESDNVPQGTASGTRTEARATSGPPYDGSARGWSEADDIDRKEQDGARCDAPPAP